MVALLAFTAAKATAEDVPGWIGEEIEAQGALLAGVLELPRVPFIALTYAPGEALHGVMAIDGTADSERITMHFTGDWRQPSTRAKRLLVRNLAHELAHSAQYALGHPTEARLFHEGFAEAMGIEAILACGPPCGSHGRSIRADLDGDCARALRGGPLSGRESWDALYGCGGAFAFIAGEKTGLGARGLYARFAAEGRDQQALLDVLDEEAGSGFALSARRFLTADHRLANPQHVLKRLRAGRL